MKLLVTGAAGQVGRGLVAAAAPDTSVVALTHADLDISNKQAVHDCIAANTPNVVINAAAYTAVDKAEENESLAMSINAEAVANLAEACKKQGCRLLQISTDFVFNGHASRPYQPLDATGPLSAYGRSKLAGERAALDTLGSNVIVLRSAWVYASKGHNFVNTMLRLMQEQDELRIVNDQLGSPTWATSIAKTCLALAERVEISGIFHWTDGGVTSWYDFALAIQDEALACNLLQKRIPLHPITTTEYPTPATRPAYSVLDCSATEQLLQRQAPAWRDCLQKMLMEKSDA
ncbi:MAG: dTDP-4-dehydrorhamnose reductase [Gammaproteobacteria bacterium]